MFEETNDHDTEVVRSFKYLGTVIKAKACISF